MTPTAQQARQIIDAMYQELGVGYRDMKFFNTWERAKNSVLTRLDAPTAGEDEDLKKLQDYCMDWEVKCSKLERENDVLKLKLKQEPPAPQKAVGDNWLFQKKEVELNSGIISDFKIDCDALTDKDLECIAYLISKRMKFREVYGIPNGGLRLQDKLKPFCVDDKNLPILICDDVMTTGNSMISFCKEINERETVGAVIFNRGNYKPFWLYSLFTLDLPAPPTATAEQ